MEFSLSSSECRSGSSISSESFARCETTVADEFGMLAILLQTFSRVSLALGWRSGRAETGGKESGVCYYLSGLAGFARNCRTVSAPSFCLLLRQVLSRLLLL